MKILYDYIIFCSQKYGGVSRYFTELIKRISAYDGIKVGSLKYSKMFPRRLAGFNNVFVSFKLTAGKYDIYHPTFYSDSVKKRIDTKTVVTVYDMIHELYFSKIDAYKKAIEVKKSSILNADHIICISKKTKEDLMLIYGIKDSDISVVYLGVSLDGPTYFSKKFKNRDKPYILYVGRRDGYKNFNMLVRAFYSMSLKKDFSLVCFGGGGFSREELSIFSELGLKDSAKHIEGNDSLLKYYYRNAALFVYPSIYEGFGLPVLEAMANDCPVVASNAGSIPEITRGSALLFSPDNLDELCRRIREMLNDIRLMDEYVKKGKDVVNDFSWDRTAAETLGIYNSVLEK